MNLVNSDDCQLYYQVSAEAGFIDVIAVNIFKDGSFSNMVAWNGGGESIPGGGTVTLVQYASSGLTGTIEWDGSDIGGGGWETGVLDCYGRSSSSSSSSTSSSTQRFTSSTSSTSSLSSTSSTSTSSGCCANPSCTGVSCSYLSNWAFTGMTDNNSENCHLYLYVYDDGTTLTVEIYKDGSYNTKVAEGSGTVGSITITQRNASGLNGNPGVTWDGTIIGSDFIDLQC